MQQYDAFHTNTKMQKRIISENNFTYRIVLNVINRCLKPGMKILDIGCGAGTISLYLASKGYTTFGIDISKKAINECRRSMKYHNLKNVNFKTLNFPEEIPSGCFDMVICTEVIEHIADDETAFKKISMILANNGILVLSTPLETAPLHKLRLTKKFDKKVGHLRRYTYNRLDKLCAANNLVVIKKYDTEGILRNFLFINTYAGKTIRFIRGVFSYGITNLDNVCKNLFGASNIILVATKRGKN